MLTESSRLLALAEHRGRDPRRRAGLRDGSGAGPQTSSRVPRHGELGLGKTQALDHEGAIADLEQAAGPRPLRRLARGGPRLAQPRVGGALPRRPRAVASTTSTRRPFSPSDSESPQLARASRSVLCVALYNTGAWDEALESADEVIAQLDARWCELLRTTFAPPARGIGLARSVDRGPCRRRRRAVAVARSAEGSSGAHPHALQPGLRRDRSVRPRKLARLRGESPPIVDAVTRQQPSGHSSSPGTRSRSAVPTRCATAQEFVEATRGRRSSGDARLDRARRRRLRAIGVVLDEVRPPASRGAAGGGRARSARRPTSQLHGARSPSTARSARRATSGGRGAARR